ncbi:hypothetical protein Ddye_032091 [Dipteronia dyeriana]|uniref:BED-type domain-containing protein n=1 Tax=Dipteronia dyeriana TaxID=168575 RepID=A0AAD9TJJ3_9ROSI|nr:hypothetical protein Ddye_032091 [Dipteronia dyeriana]
MFYSISRIRQFQVEMSSSQQNLDFDSNIPLNTQSQAPSFDINLVDINDIECESGRQTSQTNRRSTKRSSSGRPKQTSEAWNHFKREIINGEVKVICHHCGKALAGNHRQVTSHLLNHATSCLKKIGGRKQDGTSPKPNFGSVDNDILQQKNTKMIIMHELPLSFVDYGRFKDVLDFLAPGFNGLTRNTLKSEVMKLYEVEKSRTMMMLDKNTSRVALTTDM